MMHDPEASRLFVDEHDDGAGHRMRTIILGMAVAENTGMNFGGVRAAPSNVSHGVDFKKLAVDFFGLRGPEELFSYSTRPFDSEVACTDDLWAQRLSFGSSANVHLAGFFLPRTAHLPVRSPAALWITPALQSKLRAPLLARPLRFAPGRLAVAVHLRRGDLSPDGHIEGVTYGDSVLPNSWFLRVIGDIRRHAPDADVHIWSSTDNGGQRPMWKPVHFEEFRAQNCTVHLENKEVLDSWVHFARAHVLVASPSHFSMVGSLLNPNCVMGNTPFIAELNRFHDPKRAAAARFDADADGAYDAELRACIAHSGGLV